MTEPLQTAALLHERYIIRQIIGRGGMGSIYLAEDSRLPGRLCALKEVQQDATLPEAIHAQARDQFYNEASVLARLDHPNLPKVSDFFTEGDRDYLVMDYVPGDDLRTLMERARLDGQILPVGRVLEWAAQLADALEYLHSQAPPVIHRDIKPSNLKLTPSGLLKLVDFGLVKQLVPDEMTVTVIQGRGTAHYTPLEQYGGDSGHTDARSDIYAFSATLYHLLTNTPPAEAKQRFLDPRTMEPPRSLNPAIPADLERALLWGMALHPADRPSGMAIFRLALSGDQPQAAGELPSLTVARLARALSSPIDRTLAATVLTLLVLALVGYLR
jgi:eukaryotic-like serine/threonine-protein kinase